MLKLSFCLCVVSGRSMLELVMCCWVVDAIMDNDSSKILCSTQLSTHFSVARKTS